MDALHDLEAELKNPGVVSKLRIVAYGKQRPDLQILGRLPGLRTLIVSRVAIENDDLEPISKLPALESLDVSGTWITNQGVADHLVRCTKLRELNLGGTRISNACLPDLAKLLELRSLSLANTKIESPTHYKSLKLESFAALDPLDRLETLNLNHVDTLDADLLDLVRLKSLKRVYLSMSPHVSVERLYALKAKSPSVTIAPEVLSRLGLRFNPNKVDKIVEIDDIFIKDLERLGSVEDMSSVQSLSLIQPPSDKLAACYPKVRRLTLRSVKLDSRHVPILAGWKSLTELRLKECSVSWSQAEIEALAGMTIQGLKSP